MKALTAVLLQLFPLPDGVEAESIDDLPPPRVSIHDADKSAEVTRKDPLVADRQYHNAVLACNRRITAADWYQDVRHFDFQLDENVEYVLAHAFTGRTSLTPWFSDTSPETLLSSIQRPRQWTSSRSCHASAMRIWPTMLFEYDMY